MDNKQLEFDNLYGPEFNIKKCVNLISNDDKILGINIRENIEIILNDDKLFKNYINYIIKKFKIFDINFITDLTEYLIIESNSDDFIFVLNKTQKKIIKNIIKKINFSLIKNEINAEIKTKNAKKINFVKEIFGITIDKSKNEIDVSKYVNIMLESQFFLEEYIKYMIKIHNNYERKFIENSITELLNGTLLDDKIFEFDKNKLKIFNKLCKKII